MQLFILCTISMLVIVYSQYSTDCNYHCEYGKCTPTSVCISNTVDNNSIMYKCNFTTSWPNNMVQYTYDNTECNNNPVDTSPVWVDLDFGELKCNKEYENNICNHVIIKQHNIDSNCNENESYEETVYATNICSTELEGPYTSLTCKDNEYFIKEYDCGIFNCDRCDGKPDRIETIKEDECIENKIVIDCKGLQDEEECNFHCWLCSVFPSFC
eukprot:292021_1